MVNILEEGPLRKFLRERGYRSPTELLFKGTLDEIRAAIAEEKEAIDDYAALENKLRAKGLNSDADIVKEIRSDEQDHLSKFQTMFNKFELGHRPYLGE